MLKPLLGATDRAGQVVAASTVTSKGVPWLSVAVDWPLSVSINPSLVAHRHWGDCAIKTAAPQSSTKQTIQLFTDFIVTSIRLN